MSDFIFYLITLSVIGSLNFLFVYFIHKFSKHLSNRFIYLLLKFILLYLLVPVIFFVYAFRQFTAPREIPMYGEDFHSALIVRYFSLDMIFGRNKTFQTINIILLILWLTGFLYMFGYKVLTTYYRLNQLQKISTLYSQAKNISIYKTHGIDSPFIVGIKKVRIFLPDLPFSSEEMELIINHEMTHYRRGDVLFKNLMLLLQAIYWFNPCIHLFKYYFVEICELACDEHVLCRKPKDVRYEYGRLIVGMHEKQNKVRAYPLVFFSDHNEKRIKRRLTEIMLHNKKHSRILAISLSAICMLSFPMTSFGVTMGAVSLEDQITRNLQEKFTIYEVQKEFIDGEEATYYIDKETLSYVPGLWIERGINLINDTLSGTESHNIGEAYLAKGSTVQFILASSDSSHKFKAGIIDSSGTAKTVTSSNGTISHTFTITSAGDYTFFIQGITNAQISVNGSIVTN